MAGPAKALTLAALFAAARAGCQAAGGASGSGEKACDAEPDGAQPDDVQAGALLQSGRKLESVVPIAEEDVDVANKAHWDWCRVRGTCAYCTGSMYVPTVKPPWETMNEKVHGAGSKADCKRCGNKFEEWGQLESGWWCEYSWAWGAYLKRNAERSLTSMKPVRPFDLSTGARGLGPLAVGTAPLPESLRGIFWLQDQQTSSAALTFGGNGAEGAWCSTGSLVVGNRYRIRVCGEHSWAFANNYNIACDLDLIYDFTFDNPSRPTFGQIHPVLGALHHISTAPIELLADFEMTLMDHGHADYPGSVVWSRETYSFGIQIPAPASYMLVQIVDAAGARIEPAWSAFVNDQRSLPNRGTVYYRGRGGR